MITDRNNFLISAALTALILFGSSCKIQELDFNGVNDFSVGSMQSDDIEVTINVKLDNPNSFKIKVIKADLDLVIGGNPAGKAVMANKITIQKKKEDNYDIIISTSKDEIMSAVWKSAIPAATSGKVTVKVKGWIKGRVWGIGKKIDVEFKESVDLKELMKK